MTDEEILARADANYFGAMSTFIGQAEHGEIRSKDGVLMAYSGTDVAAFNVAFVTRSPSDCDRTIAEAIEFFDERNVPFILRLREDVDRESERAARERGLRYTDTVPGMVMAYPKPPPSQMATMRTRIVDDDASLSDHRSVVADAFEMPGALAEYFLTMRLFSTPDIVGYVGYVDGVAVATSALFMTHRVAGVYNVATKREYRKRGFGEAMAWRAVRDGMDAGCVMASLQASELGQPVYERMGFRTVAAYRTFGRPEKTRSS
jgi:GNAT superfamily N-acetyltransferase